VRRNRLKMIVLCWAILVMVNVWLDRWVMNIAFGGVTCLLGAGILTSGQSSTGPERKESRIVGFVFLIVEAIVTLLEATDRFIIGYR
jgi:hypothetical protein